MSLSLTKNSAEFANLSLLTLRLKDKNEYVLSFPNG